MAGDATSRTMRCGPAGGLGPCVLQNVGARCRPYDAAARMNFPDSVSEIHPYQVGFAVGSVRQTVPSSPLPTRSIPVTSVPTHYHDIVAGTETASLSEPGVLYTLGVARFSCHPCFCAESWLFYRPMQSIERTLGRVVPSLSMGRRGYRCTLLGNNFTW